jgi:site-specific recombinase XerD
MRYWISEIGDKAPKELRAYHINQCIREMEERGYKASGIVPYVSRLRTALDYARSEGKISISNDLWDEVVKIEPKATKKLIFGTEILGPIMAKMPEYALRIIRYKSLVPCRLLELYEAKSEHIDLVRRVFKITRDKNGNERYLPIPAGLYHEFEEAISCGSEWVFYRTETRKDKVYHYPLSRNHLTVLWAKAAKECGIDGKIKLRMLRHLAISEWLKHAGEAVTSEVAGANSDTMRSYYNMIPVSALVSAADKMAQIGGTLGEPSGKIVAFRSREVSASD